MSEFLPIIGGEDAEDSFGAVRIIQEKEGARDSFVGGAIYLGLREYDGNNYDVYATVEHLFNAHGPAQGIQIEIPRDNLDQSPSNRDEVQYVRPDRILVNKDLASTDIFGNTTKDILNEQALLLVPEEEPNPNLDVEIFQDDPLTAEFDQVITLGWGNTNPPIPSFLVYNLPENLQDAETELISCQDEMIPDEFQLDIGGYICTKGLPSRPLNRIEVLNRIESIIDHIKYLPENIMPYDSHTISDLLWAIDRNFKALETGRIFSSTSGGDSGSPLIGIIGDTPYFIGNVTGGLYPGYEDTVSYYVIPDTTTINDPNYWEEWDGFE